MRAFCEDMKQVVWQLLQDRAQRQVVLLDVVDSPSPPTLQLVSALLLHGHIPPPLFTPWEWEELAKEQAPLSLLETRRLVGARVQEQLTVLLLLPPAAVASLSSFSMLTRCTVQRFQPWSRGTLQQVFSTVPLVRCCG
jgi:hypothetical protein